MKNDNKIKQLKDEIINNNKNSQHHYLILKLLNQGNINDLVNKITDTKVKISVTSLTKKNYLSGNEQFLSLLNNFIYTFKENFYFLNNNFDYIIELLLQNEKYTTYLLCKRYIGDNKNIKYFSYNIKRLTTYGFYYNIKKLAKKSELINQFAKDNNLNLRKNIIDSEEGLDYLYNALLKLSICNAKELNNVLLFEDTKHYYNQFVTKYKFTNTTKKNIYDHYIRMWEKMINNYYKKIEATEILFK